MELKDFKVGDTVKLVRYGSHTDCCLVCRGYVQGIYTVTEVDAQYLNLKNSEKDLLALPGEVELVAREAPPKPTNPPGTVWVVKFEHGFTPYIKTENGGITFIDRYGNTVVAARECESNLDDPTNKGVVYKSVDSRQD